MEGTGLVVGGELLLGAGLLLVSGLLLEVLLGGRTRGGKVGGLRGVRGLKGSPEGSTMSLVGRGPTHRMGPGIRSGGTW